MKKQNAPKIVDGIKCFIDDLSIKNPYYPAEDYYWLRKIEDENFWFKSRRKILKILFKKYVDTNNPRKLLEIGCGTGGNLKMFSKFKNIELTGAEISLNYLRFIKKILPDIELAQVDALSLPYSSSFDIICAFDMLEHIDDDETVLVNIRNALKEDGLFFITVPQHKWMWSEYDKSAFHKRRYSKKELIDKLKKASFEILYSGSFVFTLFPMMIISRSIKRKRIEEQNRNEFNLPHFLNRICYLFMEIDIFLIKKGVSLPFGGSLIVVAKKK